MGFFRRLPTEVSLTRFEYTSPSSILTEILNIGPGCR